MSESRNGELPPFGRQFLEGQETLTRLGTGALGGKASGLVQVRREVIASAAAADGPFRDFAVDVPRLVVLTTEIFDTFVEHNDLRSLPVDEMRDDRIAHAFQQAELPPRWLGDLRSLVQHVHQPLAVRSSSLLEDALKHPFAGVYGTKMIPNNQQSPDERFRLLVQAIKFVLATTFFRAARDYQRASGHAPEDEKMAVIVQEIVGQRHGDRFYPHVSGVARSWNAYPAGRARPEDGVVSLALGLGKQVVDGEAAWTYSPAWPRIGPPAAGPADLLQIGQNRFWAVGMGRPPLPDPIRETEYLVHPDLTTAEQDGVLTHLVSTFDGASNRLRPGPVGPGPRLLDFAPILQYDAMPLNDLVKRLLAAGEEAADGPVEIEFALTVEPEGRPPRFGFLQMRPMRVATEQVEVTEDALSGPDVLVASTSVLGNGRRTDIADVVYVRPQTFESRLTPRIAAELTTFNRDLLNAGRPYVLIGFGRWGSSDPWLGVPVEWGQISGARVIVEATLEGMEPELSQGSHFFHNLIGFEVLYLALRHRGPHAVAWDRLDGVPAERETELVRHVRLPRPLDVRVDGRNRRGVVIHHGE